MIQLINANKIYTSKSGIKVRALDHVNLEFNARGLVFVLGKSGSGKSSLLNILGGLDSANTSKVVINGQELKRFDDRSCSIYRNTHIGFIFQEYNLMNNLDVYENIALALRLQNKKIEQKHVLEMLDMVDLKGLEKRRLDELSGGQKQRVAIARALIKDPTIILADEPTGNLDSQTSIQIFEVLKRLSQDKLVIVVTHDREYAERFGDRIITLKEGKVVEDSQIAGSEEVIELPKPIRARLPFALKAKMSFENIVQNKLRLLVTVMIVSSLVAVLSTVYTALYVSSDVTGDLMKLSKQTQLVLSEPIPFTQAEIINPKDNDMSTKRLNSEALIKFQEIAKENHAMLFPKTHLWLGEDWLRIKDLGVAISNPESLASDLVIRPNAALLEAIENAGLTFVSNLNVLDRDRLGRLPENRFEMVISSALAQYILASQGKRLLDYAALLDQYLDVGGFYRLKIVGIVYDEALLLRKDQTILNTSYTNLYVHPSFLRTNPLPTQVVSYGVQMQDETDVHALIEGLKSVGTVTILPRTSDRLNRYTRHELTILMAVLVPIIGYFALIFLGNYIASSILKRKKQIGILRALGAEIKEVQWIFMIEVLFVGLLIVILVLGLVPFMIDILNFVFKVHFYDTFIAHYHYDVFRLRLGHFIEVISLLALVNLVIVFTLTYHINILDPVDIITGR
jgi:ABC-type lipoprotein export system ATPase subunit/ABC-type lipoprotein release transport system permease subunit